MKILITGGMGFIGSNLALRLAREGHRVTIVDSMIPDYGGNLANLPQNPPNITVNISDVRDSHSFEHLVQGQEVLFNLAGQTSHMDSMENPYNDLEINCTAQLSILEACRKLNPTIRVVYASTRQIYGRPKYLPVDENHPICPVDVNGINKLAGEHYHLLYHQVYGIETCVLRLTNTIGPRMRIKDARQTFLGIWVKRILEGSPIEVWGGEQLRDFTYIDDCVEALILCLNNDQTFGKVYNLGGCEPLSLAELASELVRVSGSGEFVIKDFPADRKKIDIGDFYSDDKAFRDLTGWKHTTSISDALRATLDYYRVHQELYT